MKKIAMEYWDNMAANSPQDARDAVLAGFRSEKAFDAAGREDAENLLLPFLDQKHRVLDVGCGVGRLAKWAAPHCNELIGLDISNEMLVRAKDRLKGQSNIKLKKLPLNLKFPIKSNSIDFAYFYHVSEHMDREDAYKILLEIRRCLRSRGNALIQFSLINHSDNQNEFVRWARHGDDEGVRSRFYTEAEVTAFLEIVKLYPQLRFYIPGEFTIIATRSDDRVLGEMPLVKLSPKKR